MAAQNAFISYERLMTRMKNGVLSSAVAVMLAVLLAACSDSKDGDEEEGEASPVEVMVAKRQAVTRSLAYDGDVEGELEIQVFSRVPDRIEKLLVDVGDKVKQGQLVARIRATAIEQAVRQAEAGLVAARAQEANVRLEYERSQRLFAENALSQQQLDAIRTQFEAVTAQSQQAEAMLKSAMSQVTDAQITAPITGIVATRNYEEGDMASPALPLFTIVQMNRVCVTFDVAESDIGSLKLGQDAEVRVKSYPERVFKGRVSEISPVLDRMTRMARVEVMLDNPGHVLKPGMFARVEIRIGTIPDVIVLPRYATIEHTSLTQQGTKEIIVKHYVAYVVKGDRAEERALDVAYLNHEIAAVVSGISEGEQVVIVGQYGLRDSARVSLSGQKGTAQ